MGITWKSISQTWMHCFWCKRRQFIQVFVITKNCQVMWAGKIKYMNIIKLLWEKGYFIRLGLLLLNVLGWNLV